MSRLLPVGLGLALAASGCANSTAFLITADTLDTFERGMELLNDTYTRASAAGKVTAAQVDAFNAFQAKVQAVYPSLVAAWRTARATNDLAKQHDVERLIAGIIAEAGELAQAVGLTLQQLGITGGK